jgi:phosphoribosylformylglycinamidine (FGAM) synthase PurS component
MATNSFLKPNPASSKSDKNADSHLSKIRQLIENFNIGKFYELTVNKGERERERERERENYKVTNNIAESRRHECTKLQIKIAGEEIQALIDTVCEMSILNEGLCNKLRHAGLQCL